MKNKDKDMLDWESSRIEQVVKSEKRAWRVSAIFAICFGLSITAIVLMMPLKQTLPYVIRVNATTGEINAMTALRNKNVQFDEIQDKYWIANYVRARESYDWHTIENDYQLTEELSVKEAFLPVLDLYRSNNAPTKIYSNKKRVITKLSSITLNKGSASNVATVRLSKMLVDNASNSQLGITNWVITMSYDYEPKTLASENSRLLNPFGFKVISYRIDPEINNLQP